MRILFCTAPTIALFNIKHYGEPNLGAAEVAGALKSNGAEVIHLDLNAALNEYRRNNEGFSNQILGLQDFNILASRTHLKHFFENPVTTSPLIESWAIYLSNYVKTFVGDQPVDAICFSIPRQQQMYYIATGSFNMSIILRKYLNYIDDTVPFYIGGVKVYTMLDKRNYFDNIKEYVPVNCLPVYYIVGEAHLVFYKYISDNLEKDKEYLKERNKNVVSGEVRAKLLDQQANSTYLPDVKPLNFRSAELEVSTYFPDNMISHFPELGKIKPFNYYSYRFTDGCIFKCSFCTTTGIPGFNKLTRKDDPSQVVDCLEHFYDSGIKYVRFFNNNINFKMSWVKEFCNEVVKRNLKIKWSDSANLKVGDHEMFQAMGEAGCVKLWYGTETVSPRILKEINKEVSPERIDTVLNWVHEAGIWNCSNFIVNLPHESDEEYEMLRNFIKKYYDAGILNGFSAHVLEIIDTAEMQTNPERFRITLHEEHNVVKKLIYTEDNNASWEEIYKRGEYRLKHLADPVNISDPKLFSNIFENDYFFFSMYEAYGGDKNIKKKIYTHLFDNEKIYRDFIDTNFNIYIYHTAQYAEMFKKVNRNEDGIGAQALGDRSYVSISST